MNQEVALEMVGVDVARRLGQTYRIGTKKEKSRVLDQFL